MYKKLTLIPFLLLILLSSASGEGFTKKATNSPVLTQKGTSKHWCPICGMKIKNFYKTSHSSTLKDGTNRQYCSMRCLAVDMKEHNIDKNKVSVIDAKTEQPILAKNAYYVVNSKIMGTMSKVSKLAFKDKIDADKFAKKFKGNIVRFDEALKMAKKSLKFDIAMFIKKKKKMMYPRGKKIYNKICKKELIDPTKYIEINQLKEDIVSSKLCKPMKEKDLQAIALYVWEVKRFEDLDKIENKIKVTHDEKCPVCGMFAYKYPRWVAQIFYKDGSQHHHLSFDGVKDLMKFYFNSNKWGEYKESDKDNISKILVTDYYSQKAIDGTKAYYVIRSDVYGPMGHELIPFELESDAKTFKKDHNAKSIVKFKDIKEDQVYKLDLNE